MKATSSRKQYEIVTATVHINTVRMDSKAYQSELSDVGLYEKCIVILVFFLLAPQDITVIIDNPL
jgi:hypothetical protein